MEWWESLENVGRFGFNTVSGLVEQFPAVIKVGHSTFFHRDTRRIALQSARIFLEDITLAFVVNYVHDLLQNAGQAYLDEQGDYSFLSIYMAMQLSLYLLTVLNSVYKTRKQAQIFVRTAVLNLEASSTLVPVNQYQPMTICREERCGKMKFTVGQLRGLSSFYVTEFSLAMLRFVPHAGNILAEILSVFHNGRYIQQTVMPEMCNEHQMIYLKEMCEYVLALGINHAATSYAITWFMEKYTGVPATYYESYIKQFVLLFSISLAAHMRKPAPVRESSRLPDPVALFQEGSNLAFNVVVSGLRKELPPLLKKRSEGLPWGLWAAKAAAAWQHPVARYVEFFVVPRMLRSKRAFIQDPVIAPNWEGVRKTLIKAIDVIIKIQGKFYIKAAIKTPKKAAKLLHLALGIPKPLSEQLLTLMGNKAFMEWIRELRATLIAMAPGRETGVIINPFLEPLRSQHDTLSNPARLSSVSQTSLNPADQLVHLMNSDHMEVMDQILTSTSTPTPIEDSSGSSNRIGPDVLDSGWQKPEKTRKENHTGFFAPASTIPLQTVAQPDSASSSSEAANESSPGFFPSQNAGRSSGPRRRVTTISAADALGF